MLSISDKTRFDKLEQLIVRDERFIWTISSCVMIFLIFVNMNTTHSPAMGIVVSVIFLFINSVFLGNAFFENKDGFLRFAFGGVLLIALIGIVGWIVLIIYNLGTISSTVVLGIVGVISSIINRASHYTFSIEFVKAVSSA